MNLSMRFMYSAGFWIRKNQGVRLGEWLLSFLQSYGQCARLCFDAGLNRFSLMPKLHFLHHESLWLIHAPDAEWVRNPLSNSVQMQEDYVGRPSRLSRRVAVPQVHRRVMDRSLISSYQAILASDKDERGLV